MKLQTSFTLILFATSGAAMAQTAAPVTSQAAPNALQTAVQQKATAFGQCVFAGMQGLQASVPAQAGATQVLGGCSSQRDQLVQAAQNLIASLPEEQRGPAQAELQGQLGQAQTRVAAEIDRRRAAAATPAPAPAPAQ